MQHDKVSRAKDIFKYLLYCEGKKKKKGENLGTMSRKNNTPFITGYESYWAYLEYAWKIQAQECTLDATKARWLGTEEWLGIP